MKKRSLGLALIFVATASLAHEGVKNPDVMARMQGMKTIGSETKVLGDMAKGSTAFDAARAQAAALTLKQEAARIAALFETRADDPKSEALPAVWENFPDYVVRADALVNAATEASNVQSVEDLQTAMREIGATCSACHKVYRKP